MVEAVTLPGIGVPLDAIFDGGAETCILSYDVYMAMDPRVQPILRPSEQHVRGMFSDTHTPIGEVTLSVTIPSLGVIVEYDFIVDNTSTSEPLIIDNSFMVYAGIDNHYRSGCLKRGSKTAQVAKRLSRVTTCRRITLAEQRTLGPHTRPWCQG